MDFLRLEKAPSLKTRTILALCILLITNLVGAQMDEGFITTEDGVRLFFQKLGKGTQTLIIPNAIYMFDDFKYLSRDRTVIFYDLRNRGRSDSVSDPAKLKRGVLQDVDDLEAVRRHFGYSKVDLIGHSYLGMTVVLYTMKFPEHVNRIVQIGPMQPNSSTQYPENLTGADEVQKDVFAKLGELQKERAAYTQIDFCKKFWSVLIRLYVMNPQDVNKLSHWGFCELPNEMNMMKHFRENIIPSIQSLNLTPEELKKVESPVLTIHGTKDRNAPYGGGKEWAALLPNARLLTVENAAHVPWIESPELVFNSISEFLK